MNFEARFKDRFGEKGNFSPVTEKAVRKALKTNGMEYNHSVELMRRGFSLRVGIADVRISPEPNKKANRQKVKGK